MYKRITSFAIIAVAFLIYPLSLSSQNSFSLSLDTNGAAGDQATTSVNVSPDQLVAIQIFGRDIQNANGISVRFEYDAGQVGYDSFDAGDVLPNAVVLPAESGTNPTFVQISLGALGGQATSNTGLIGTIHFRTTAAFSGTSIRLVRGELGRGGQFERVTLNVSVELQSGPAFLTPDFNGDGMVGFADFVQFAGVFGASRGDGTYQAKYDLDSDGTIGFSDFVIFVNDFGKPVSPPSGGGGTPPTSTDFDLDSDNSVPEGIIYANNRFYVVDWSDDKVYVYTNSGQRVASADFVLDSDHGSPQGITYANNRFYVVDVGDLGVFGDGKVYVYTNSGQRVASADFVLDRNNGFPTGITYANNRFYVVDIGGRDVSGDEKVYVYTNSGQRVASADFDLDSANGLPGDITYANNRFYVVDIGGRDVSGDEKVYVYTSSGQRVASADFDLDSANGFPTGITYANNRFYVVDWVDDKVYVYTSAGQSGSGGGSGGSNSPDLIVESPSVSNSSPNTGQSFTLRATVRNQGNGPSAATTLRYYRSSNATISTSDTEVGTDTVNGLSASNTSADSISLNAPSSAGTYYYGACVDNVSGESDTGNNCSTGVRITVSSNGGTPPTSTDFDLDSDNSDPTGIIYANNRFYVVDSEDEKVYVYTNSGQRVASADFDLDSDHGSPQGITYANNRFYVVDWEDEKVYVYTNAGQHISSADFDLDSRNSRPISITYANNRFYVVDIGDEKVYVYTSSGQRVASADFDLDSANGHLRGITYANNRFYVVDLGFLFFGAKVYVYTSAGQRVASADFDLDSANGLPHGITYANNRFYVVDWSDDKVYVYTSSGQSGSGGGGGAGDDHGNTRSGATSLSLNDSRSGRIETGSDVDYFRIQVSELGLLTVYTTGSLDTQGTLQDSISSLRFDDDSGNDTNFGIAESVISGTYYIRVEPDRSSGTGSYTLHTRFDTHSPEGDFSIYFDDTFNIGETRAYDFQWRKKNRQEFWSEGCTAPKLDIGDPGFAFDRWLFTSLAHGSSGPIRVTTFIEGLEYGTTYEVRYRYRNSSSCSSGNPRPWSGIAEVTAN